MLSVDDVDPTFRTSAPPGRVTSISFLAAFGALASSNFALVDCLDT